MILEEVNQHGGNAGPAHAQMYIMGALITTWRRAEAAAILTGDRQADRSACRRSGSPNPRPGPTPRASRPWRTARAIVTSSRPQDLHFPRPALRSDAAAGADVAAGRAPSDGRSLRLPGRSAGSGRGDQARRLRDVDEQRDERGRDHGAEVPAENLVGVEGQGFRQIIDGWNAERILIAAECVGDGRWFIDAPPATPRSGRSSAVRSGRTRASSFPLPPPGAGGSGRSDGAPRRCPLRRRTLLRPGGQHGQTPGVGCELGGGQCGDRHAGWARVRRRL